MSFQLTRSRGAWLISEIQSGMKKDFNSHAHVERDPAKPFRTKRTRNFNSHAHVERDPTSASRFRYSVDFNSHAHVERDSILSDVWGLAAHFNSHAHVERDLRIVYHENFGMSFQLTRSRGAWHRHYKIFYKNKKFQLTRSRGAWHSS